MLYDIGCLSAESCHSNLQQYIFENKKVFEVDGRGGNRLDEFYLVYPEIEILAKEFVWEQCVKKGSNFNVSSLMNFINDTFYEITGILKEDNSYIRSQTSCTNDLLKWGIKFDPVSKKPYFEGHERADVVLHREKLCDYFVNRIEHYSFVTEGDPLWIDPTKKPCIVLCHDESTFRSGEQSAKRWIIKDSEIFLNKGMKQYSYPKFIFLFNLFI